MRYLYLDESGDLGLDLSKQNSSKYFSITLLSLPQEQVNKKFIYAVKKTLKRKLNKSKYKKRYIQEIKASSTTLDIKKYFYSQVQDLNWQLYSIVIDKQFYLRNIHDSNTSLYDWGVVQLLDCLPLMKFKHDCIDFYFDKSKKNKEISQFNEIVKKRLTKRFLSSPQIYFHHHCSQEVFGLQAADLFSWGLFQKYEKENLSWYSYFKSNIRLEKVMQ